MRETIWIFLRKSSVLRKLYAHPILARPMRFASHLLVPPSSRKWLRVQAGPAKGLILELDPRWEHSAWDGSYELETAELFFTLVKKDMTFLDVGSGLGFYALLAGRAGANVITFEPDPKNAASVLLHVEINRLADRIRLVRQAVFSHTGHVTLEFSDGESAHHNTKVCAAPKVPAKAFEAQCTTLDDFIQASSAPTLPTLVKIDVEGAESEVLRGADRLFRTSRIRLLCEVHDDTNAAFAHKWLKERGYGCRWIEKEPSFPRHLLAWPENEHA